jgi:aminopeptidase N
MKSVNTILFLSLLWTIGCKSGKPSKSPVSNASAPSKVVFPYSPSRTLKNDLLHTKLEVSFDWGKQFLYGKASLTLKPYFYPQNSVELDAKGFDIAEVTLLPDHRTLTYTYDKKKLLVYLDKTYTKEQPYSIEIRYTAKPNDLPKGGSAAITSDKGLYFINPDGKESSKPKQIWTQGETEASSCWFPTMDTPNEKTTQEIYITVDKGYKTLSNGTLISSKNNGDSTRTDYWKQDKPHAPYLVMMAVGNFTVVKDTMPKSSERKNLEVNYYVEPAYGPHAKAVFGRTPEMIDFFSKLLKYPYPWDKYSQVVVRDYVSGAMENTTATVMMDGLQCTTREMLDKNWDNIIAHELFHHWFGDLVTCESWPNLPLNESFANYSEFLWQEYKYGRDAADHHGLEEMEGYLSESAGKQEPIIRYHLKDFEDMFDAHSYNKGGRVLHMLRKQVGDEAFFQSLHLYLTRKQFGTAEINDLRMAFEETTGEDLNWFFNQWFLYPGHPKLKVEQTWANEKLLLKFTQEQDTTTTPVYRLPLKVGVWTNGEKKSYSIDLQKKTQTFGWTMPHYPDLVLVDEEAQLLGVINHLRKVKEYAFEYKNAPYYRHRLRALEGLMAIAIDSAATIQTMQSALSDPFFEIRKAAIDYFDIFRKLAPTEAVSQIQGMAISDPKNSVKARAIQFLSKEADTSKYIAIYKKGLEDSSFVVQAASLKAYLSTSALDKGTVLANFEKSQNSDILNALATYYSEKKITGKQGWFVQNIGKLSGEALFVFLDNFGSYLPICSAEEKQNSIPLLENIARNHSVYYIRFAGFKALSKLPETKELRKDIADKETDERLKGAYKRFE